MRTITMKIRITILVLLACIAGAAVAGLGFFGAEAEMVVESGDDAFELTSVEYAADEKFAFSATADFESGNAAGLVFGATEGEAYWVFNVDRASNAVKLMYFDYSSGGKTVYVVDEEYYVGTALMNDGEKDYVRSRTENIDKVYLQVVIMPTENGEAYAEFYADGIRRFAYVDGSEEAVKIDLNALTAGDDGQVRLSYGGGRLGYNCFNARVRFTDEEITGESTSYSEIYRNQYHFSQFAHWNNDPNGMVYYNGYYHLYFQHNPYGNTWDAMHWGHARSKDLVHWELLPIALVPDRDLSVDGGIDYGIGAMWSGSARVYRKGDSNKIDNEYRWFGDLSDKNDGDALGLIGFYTRFDKGGNRHQIVMYSTDGGLSWNKRDNIPSTVSIGLNGNPIVGESWRDPKVFDISDIADDGYKWGMVLTNMEGNEMYFLKSTDFIDWAHAGCYEVYRPECPDLVKLNDGTRERTVITFTSRYYVVCDLAYENGNIVMLDSDGNKIERLMRGDPQFNIMDYGVDSYAAQTFYIDPDSDSEYAGKSVSMSWFSGVPNAPESIESGALQSARKVWNGGGMTIPVVYGLDGEKLTVTPITATDAEFDKLKTPRVNITDAPMSNGLLDSVKSRTAEIIAKLSSPTRGDVSFKVNMNSDGSRYTEIGWNRREGYFVDRTHTEDGDISFPQPNYAVRYASGMGRGNTVLDFYILVDRNNVEVYCDGFTIPFYILTFASPYSDCMSFTSSDDLNIIKLEVNTIGSAWRDGAEDNTLYVSETDVEIGMSFPAQKQITVVSGGKAEYEIVSGNDVIEIIPSSVGFTVKAVAAGSAVVAVKSGDQTRLVNVTVHSGAFTGDLTFTEAGIVSGNWIVSGNTLIGEQLGGDGYILAEESGADFIYSATFDLGSGAAAAIVFRAEASGNRLGSYIIANYDRNANVVKLWSQKREIARADYTPADVRDITITAFVEGDRVKISINGTDLIDAILEDGDPKSGHFGLNACATRATFKAVNTVLREYEYGGGFLEINVGGNTRIDRVVNRTFANTAVAPGFYLLAGGKLIIDEAYWSTLPNNGVYEFDIFGDKLSVNIKVDVAAVPEYFVYGVTVTQGNDANIFIGRRSVEYVKVNGTAIRTSAYTVSGYTLRLKGDVLTVGPNAVVLSDGTEFTVSVLGKDNGTISIYHPPIPLDYTAFSIGAGITGGVILLCLIAFIIVAALAARGKLTFSKPFADRTAAVRRRNLGLIVAACSAGPVALFIAVCALTAPIGNAALWALTAVAVLFGYPYAAQLVWRGKLYNATLSPTKTMGTPKEIFETDKSGNKFKNALRYIGAAFKTLWLCIRILLCAIVSFIRAPFLFAGQLKGVTYGEFGFSNQADSIEADGTERDAVIADTEIGVEE